MFYVECATAEIKHCFVSALFQVCGHRITPVAYRLTAVRSVVGRSCDLNSDGVASILKQVDSICQRLAAKTDSINCQQAVTHM